MRSYKFSLEDVLEWRTGIEKGLIEKFASHKRALKNEESILHSLIAEYKSMKKKKLQYNNINQLYHRQLYMEIQEEKIEAQKLLVQSAEKNLKKVQDELIDAKQDREIMEKLKEKDLELYKNKMKTLEQKEVDETAILRYQKAPGF